VSFSAVDLRPTSERIAPHLPRKSMPFAPTRNSQFLRHFLPQTLSLLHLPVWNLPTPLLVAGFPTSSVSRPDPPTHPVVDFFPTCVSLISTKVAFFPSSFLVKTPQPQYAFFSPFFFASVVYFFTVEARHCRYPALYSFLGQSPRVPPLFFSGSSRVESSPFPKLSAVSCVRVSTRIV